MRVVLQRVKEARVDVADATVGSISTGLLILIGVTSTDTQQDAEYLADKVINLRIFPDGEHRMNRSIMEVGGSLLVVSQFTLYGDCRKGRRPSFDRAALPSEALGIYNLFVDILRRGPVPVETGIFQAAMEVHLVNQGPVTLLIDSADRIKK